MNPETPKRNVYLKLKRLEEARRLVFEHFELTGTLGTERLAVPDAVGRVLAEPVAARVSSPNFHSAAMDGVAVRAADTFGASEAQPRRLTLAKQAHPVNTGHVLPPDTDAVIMIEHVLELDPETIQIEAPVFPWQNVRKMGEDIVATELLFARNHRVTPYCVGALLSGGVFEVTVWRRPRVLIIPTGSELVDWQAVDVKQLRPGQVLESNSIVLGKLVEACGGWFERCDLLADDLARITETVSRAVAGDFQMVMTIGGSSAGSQDFTRPVLEDLGKILVHGVTIMPGKPVIIGDVKGKPVFGMPGYPVSAIIAFEQFARPLIFKMLGQPDPQGPVVPVAPTRKIASKLGVEEFLRVKLGQVGDTIVATPLPRGAGVITSLTEADGIIRIPHHVEGFKDDDAVHATLLKPVETLQNTIVVVGSHDNTLDVLADELMATGEGVSLSSSHVGSMGGLMAIRRGGCHLAGTHLLDTGDGTYNLSYIRRLLADTPVRLVHLVMREQGLIVPRGNPKGVKGIEDLIRPEITFINRQGGSGTRILLDYRLGQLGLKADEINGYTHEEFTHMAVAVAVLGGTADVGLGIYAAAKALEMDFIPVVTEQYDLAIVARFFEQANIRLLLKIINSNRFKQRAVALGGYNTDRTGELLL